ncbi:ABC transporter permease [Halobacteriales archaeon Cl-PHB]
MLAATAPLAVTVQELVVQVLNGLTRGGIYVLIAIGLSLIFGVMNVVNFAHGSLWMLGVYLTLTVVGASFGSFWLALLLVPLGMAVVGAAMETTTFRPLYGRDPLYHILLTFGFTLVFTDVVRYFWGSGYQPSPQLPEVLTGAMELSPGIFFPRYRLFVLGMAVVLSLLVWSILRYTAFGLIVRAGTQNRKMTRSLGVNVSRYYTLVFAFGSALAGIAGVLSANIFTITPGMWAQVIILAFIIVIVGGLGSFKGAVAAGFLIGMVEALDQPLLELGTATFGLPSVIQMLDGYLVFLLLFVVLLVRPAGLFGKEGHLEDVEANIDIDTSLPTINYDHPYFLAVLGLLLAVPFVLGNYLEGVVVQIMIVGLFALSLDIVTGYTGLISFGHALFLGLAAYGVGLIFANITGLVFVAVPAVIVAAAVVAWAIGYLSFRVSGVYFAMLTLAVAEMFHQMVVDFDDLTNGTDGFGIIWPGVPLLDLGDTTTIYFLTLVTLVGLYLLSVRILDSPFGTSLKAIRDSEERMEALGYDVNKYKRRAFLLSGAIGGVAGVMHALWFRFASPSSVLEWTVSGDVLVTMVLGGMGTLYGPLVGAAVFVGLESQVSRFVTHWEFVLGSLFILFVIFAPRGLVSLPGRFRRYLADRSDDSTVPTEPEPEESADD